MEVDAHAVWAAAYGAAFVRNYDIVEADLAFISCAHYDALEEKASIAARIAMAIADGAVREFLKGNGRRKLTDTLHCGGKNHETGQNQ